MSFQSINNDKYKKINFGKHRGRTYEYVFEHDKNYTKYILSQQHIYKYEVLLFKQWLEKIHYMGYSLHNNSIRFKITIY